MKDTKEIGDIGKTSEVSLNDDKKILERSNSIKQNVDNLIEDTPKDKLKYFLKELFKRNFHIDIKVDNKAYSNDGLVIEIAGSLLKNQNIEGVQLDMIGKSEKNISTNEFHTLKVGGSLDMSITQSYGDTIKIEFSRIKGCSSSLLKVLKHAFEGSLFPSLHIFDGPSLTSSNIKEMIDVEGVLVSYEKTKFHAEKLYNKKIDIPYQTMLSLIDSIFSGRDNYYIKLEKVFYSSNSLKMFIYDSGVNLSMNIEIELGDKLCITVTDKYGLMDQYFIENIINKMLYKIDSLVDSEESLTELLKNVGVMVIESSEENNDNSLEALYKQEGFLGYEKQKEKIEKSIIFPWIHKEKYLESQRKDFSNIKNLIPNAVLFEGPPGNGKTTEAKIIGKYLGYPFIYIPISTLVSKWYGESEGKLNYIFDLVGNIADEKGGAVIMIDEIDEIGTNRDDSYEATARVTGVLLKKLDSIEKVDNILLIGATNRKNVLDPALLSRFSNQIFFDNPDRETIKGIIQYYLPSLGDMPEDMYNSLEGKSGRYITSLCTEYSRSYLYKVEKEKVEKDKINQEELFKSLLIEEDKQNKK